MWGISVCVADHGLLAGLWVNDTHFLRSLSLRMRGGPRRDLAVQMDDMHITRAVREITPLGRCEARGCIWKTPRNVELPFDRHDLALVYVDEYALNEASKFLPSEVGA